MLEPRQWLGWVASAAVVAVAVATAGWGNDTTVRRHQPPPAVPPTSVSSVRPVALVARADLALSDLPGGYHEVQARSGNDLDPGDRLHLCGTAAPPASGRVAGHRRAFLAPDRRRVRTEIAVYADGGADRALDALRSLAPRCSRPVPPGGVELPSVLALHVALTRTTADPERREVVVLRSGEALAVLEVDGAAPARTIELARTVAARLDRSGRPATTPATSASALASVALRPGDLPAGFVVQSDLSGRELDGNPTRDACGRLLAGDAHRRAARQLVLAGNGRRVTGEVASYEAGGSRRGAPAAGSGRRRLPPRPARRGGRRLRNLSDGAPHGHRPGGSPATYGGGPAAAGRPPQRADRRPGGGPRRPPGEADRGGSRGASCPAGQRFDRVESKDGHNVVHGLPLARSLRGRGHHRATDPNPRTAP
ncbi:hypothetical protein KRR39_04025 [Nocardioides panacis]|uniref:Uncharacterized protein n=1 Tax=Nocardioides panacis TaxID=2849501 RepID=A0A975Y105_9ACTN|nr:hypothetical protein [Nocardioides panacis]QWZ09005.1 hypothetical protein KRR39_04025 [Nocardioides panacis]